MQWTNGEFVLTDDRRSLDAEAITQWLSQTYWAAGRSRAVTEAAIANSICFGLFHHGRQIGFCRAVTDQVTFTWIADVIVRQDYRGRGLGKWMVQCLLEHPQLQTRSQLLGTKDAHSLYERFGFKRAEYLVRKPRELQEKVHERSPVG